MENIMWLANVNNKLAYFYDFTSIILFYILMSQMSKCYIYFVSLRAFFTYNKTLCYVMLRSFVPLGALRWPTTIRQFKLSYCRCGTVVMRIEISDVQNTPKKYFEIKNKIVF